jgi:hypothetical protein
MPKLISEDDQSPSFLGFDLGERIQLREQIWQNYSLYLRSGSHVFELSRPGEKQSTIGSTSSDPVLSGALFCREPKDEVQLLIKMLEELTANAANKVLFEPAEPCFELLIASTSEDGYNVEIWLDSGNTKTGIYRWDAAGIRFHTIRKHIDSFIGELREKAAC